MESDSDDDLAGYAPSGLSQSSNKPDSPSRAKKAMLAPVKEEEQMTTSHGETLRRGELGKTLMGGSDFWTLSYFTFFVSPTLYS
jgi:hypothetical protein